MCSPETKTIALTAYSEMWHSENSIPSDPSDLAEALAFALRFLERKRVHKWAGDEPARSIPLALPKFSLLRNAGWLRFGGVNRRPAEATGGVELRGGREPRWSLGWSRLGRQRCLWFPRRLLP